MDNVYIDSFSKATVKSLRLLLDIDVKENNLQAPRSFSNQNICVGIPIVGALKGSVIYTFPVKTAIETVEIMSGMKLEQADDFVISAISEIANIISGNAVTELAEQNIICDIRPPFLAQDGPQNGVCKTVYTGIGDIGLSVDIH